MKSDIIKRAIITGSTGGPGQALVRKLLSEEVEVLLLIRNNSGRAKYLPQNDLVHIVHCDLQDLSKLNVEKQYDVFFHLGWDYTAPDKRNDPYYQYKNIKTTLDTVMLAKSAGCKKFVGCGSQAEYGRTNCKLTSKVPCNPTIAYGSAKLCASQMAKLLCEKNSIRFNWLRVLSAYGPVDSPNNVISTTIRNLLNNQKVMLTSGEQIWDLIYTEDLANAFLKVAQKGLDGKTYVLGSGTEMTLRQQLECIADILGKRELLQFGMLPYSQNQIMDLSADNSEIIEDTGWFPKTRLVDGMKKTILFWKFMNERYGDKLEEKYFAPGDYVTWEDQ